MIIVSDTSPISNLVIIGRLQILQQLFSEIVLPPAVNEEILALQQLGINISDYRTAPWISTIHPTDTHKVQTLESKLDIGEAQAIALALEIGCDLLLMDERLGTNIARSEGLRTIGLLGVLVRAKELFIVESVGEVLSELRHLAGFWLDADLERAVLTEVGEI